MRTTRHGSPYVAVRIEGGLLPEDLLGRIAAGDKELPGNRPEDYHLAVSERLGDAASRKWDYLRGAYSAFKDRLDAAGGGGNVTSMTRDRWLQILLGELGWGRVPYVRGIDADGRRFPVSHLYDRHVPVHLVGWDHDLDHRSGPGEAGRAPQSMLQDFLNVSDDHLWGVLSNGRQLRILRDSTSLVGSAYVEFDLEAVFDGELYAEFFLLFALLHASRFEPLPREDGEPTPADCRIEKWRAYAEETGTRAREQLRDGVERALNELGTGFLAANPDLRARLADGRLTLSDLHHELLRLAYQLIFLFVAEDRGALPHPDAAEEVRERYAAYFSTARLRRLAVRRRGDRHGDLWRALVLVLDALGRDEGEPELGLYGLGGLFFTVDGDGHLAADASAPDLLRGCELPNESLLSALRLLAEVRDRKGRKRTVDYQHLGADELGSIYESLLELVPRHDPAVPRFWLETLPGNDRKTTGSYYTPSSLIEALLDSALDPLIDEHAASGDPDDLLKLTVCDPACGSGAFLVAASRRIAKRYAAMRSGDDEPTPESVREALHQVVERCVYGVDINPLAAELAKVSLWLESLEPGKPLAFLDAHIKVGNSLLGTTPKLLAEGLPDGAFKPIEGDDKKIAASLRKQNAAERGGQDTLFGMEPVVRVGNTELAEAAVKLTTAQISSLADVRRQARVFIEFSHSAEMRRQKRLADAWCAAFVWPKHSGAPAPITTATLRMLDSGEVDLLDDVATELDRLTEHFRFFHWHIEFSEVFPVGADGGAEHNPDTGWRGGFSCVIGNPPWERVKLQEKEFFASRHEGIFTARNAAERKKKIAALGTSPDPAAQALFTEFQTELRVSAGWSHLLRESGRYPLTGQGDVNTYSVFAETGSTVVGPAGRSGMVLPTGIVTDATTAPFFGDLVATKRLISVYDFENEEKIFPEVHNQFRFCLLVVAGILMQSQAIELSFRARGVSDIDQKRFRLSPEDIERLNPNTLTCPVFDNPRHAQTVTGIYRRIPVLWRKMPEVNPWGLSFLRMFDMANDSQLFRSGDELEREGWVLRGSVYIKGGKYMLPLYEGKMMHHYDSRFSTYEGATEAQLNKGTLPRVPLEWHVDPSYVPKPRHWVAESEVDKGLNRRKWVKGWLLGWRDITNTWNERTVIFSFLPKAAVGHTLPIAFTSNEFVYALYANLASLIVDYVARQKMTGTHLTYAYLNQLPVVVPEVYDQPAPWSGSDRLCSWIRDRVLELSYTADDLTLFARDLEDAGAPFIWNDHRRFLIRAELDAAYFHLYGIERNNVAFIVDSFGAFQRNNPEGFTRTKELILEVYDAMAKSIETGEPYRTILDPPPGQGPRHPS